MAVIIVTKNSTLTAIAGIDDDVMPGSSWNVSIVYPSEMTIFSHMSHAIYRAAVKRMRLRSRYIAVLLTARMAMAATVKPTDMPNEPISLTLNQLDTENGV